MPEMPPITIPEGMTYGASFDLKPPLARNTTAANRKPNSAPQQTPFSMPGLPSVVWQVCRNISSGICCSPLSLDTNLKSAALYVALVSLFGVRLSFSSLRETGG